MVQAEAVVIEQASPVQQAPVMRGGQGLVVQSVSRPAWTPPTLLQSDCVWIEQVPSGPPMQQAPTGSGQMLGRQTPPFVHVPMQLTCVVSVHVPFQAQHEPMAGGCGQG